MAGVTAENKSDIAIADHRDEAGRFVDGNHTWAWARGESGNPGGRGSFSATAIEWLNQMRDWDEDRLESCAHDRTQAAAKRTAAIEVLEVLARAADMHDFEGLCEGETTLRKLKKSGVPTRRIKRLVTRTIETREGSTETRRELEFGSDGAASADRILDRTGGKPLSRNQVEVAQRIDLDAAKQFLDQIAAKLGVVRGPDGDLRRVEAKVIESIRSEVIHGV